VSQVEKMPKSTTAKVTLFYYYYPHTTWLEPLPINYAIVAVLPLCWRGAQFNLGLGGRALIKRVWPPAAAAAARLLDADATAPEMQFLRY
jgi:hypothetical protein